MSEESKRSSSGVTNPADDRKTTASSLSTSSSGNRKVVIKSADMKEEMQNEAVNIAISAFENCSVEKDVAEQIKKEFDKNHGPTWHCIVGKNFGLMPPVLKNATDFQHWKIRFENVITYIEPDLWTSIVYGPHIPESIPPNDRTKYATNPVSLKGLKPEEENKVKLDLKAYALLTMGLPMEVLMCVRNFKTAKSLWDRLEVMFEGNHEMKQLKKDKLKYQFATFSHVDGETVRQQLYRFLQLVNELKTYEVQYDTYDLNEKLLHTLPESWKESVTLLKNTINISTVKVEDMIAKVEAFEMDESIRNNPYVKIDPYKFTKTYGGVSACVCGNHLTEPSQGGVFRLIDPTSSSKTNGSSQSSNSNQSSSSSSTAFVAAQQDGVFDWSKHALEYQTVVPQDGVFDWSNHALEYETGNHAN